MAKTIRAAVSYEAKFVVSDAYLAEVRHDASTKPERKLNAYVLGLNDEQLAEWIVKKFCDIGTKSFVDDSSCNDVRFRTSPTKVQIMERVDG